MTLDAGWDALDEGDPFTARSVGEQALAAAADPEARAEAWALILAAATDLDPPADDLLELTERAAAVLGEDDPGLAFGRGCGLFYAGRFEEALPALERAAADDEAGDASFYLGACLERFGRLAEADQALRRAAQLGSEEPPTEVPVRLADDELERVIAEALAELPPPIAAAVRESCLVTIEAFPSQALVAAGTDPLLLGLCEGTVELQRLGEAGPARVIVYRRNLEKVAASREDLIEELRVTLFHEIGHALGFDEHGVEGLGLA